MNGCGWLWLLGLAIGVNFDFMYDMSFETVVHKRGWNYRPVAAKPTGTRRKHVYKPVGYKAIPLRGDG